MDERARSLREAVLGGDLAPKTLRELADVTEELEKAVEAAKILKVGNTVRVLRGTVAHRAMIADVNDDGTIDVVLEGGALEEATVPSSSASALLDFELRPDVEDPLDKSGVVSAERRKSRGSALFGVKDYVAASKEYTAALAHLKKRLAPVSTGSLVLVNGKGGLRIGTVTGRDDDTIDVLYEGEAEDEEDDLPMKRCVALVGSSEETRRIQTTCYLNLARCASHVARHKDAVAASTLAGGIADFDNAGDDHKLTAKLLRARAHLAQSHLKHASRDSAAATAMDPTSKPVLALQRDVERAKRLALKANKQLAKDVTSWVASAQEKYAETGGDDSSCAQQ